MFTRSLILMILLSGSIHAAAGEAWSWVHSGGIGRWIVALAASPDRFVALTESQALLHSEDGETWSPANALPPIGQLNALSYGNGVFVAAGEGVMLVSANGIDWTRQVTTGISFSSLHFTGDQFVGAHTLRGVYHSNDGVNWVRATSVPSTVSAGKFVTHAGTTLFSTAQGTLYKNSGGMSWSAHAVPFNGQDLFWNGSSWAVLSQGIHWTSGDGANWTQAFGVLPPANILGSIDTDDGPIVVGLNEAFRGGGTGVQHETYPIPSGQSITTFARSGDRILLGGRSAALHAYDIGVGWTSIQGIDSLSNMYAPTAVLEHAGRLYAWPSAGKWVISTADGTAWSADSATIPEPQFYTGLLGRMASFGGLIYGASGDWIMRSADGKSWSAVAQMPWPIVDLATDGTTLLVVGAAPFAATGIATSTDGDTWSPQANLTTSRPPNRALHDGTLWSIYYDNSTRMASPDGVVWTPQATTLPAGAKDLNVIGDRYAARGSNVAYVSADGVSWAASGSNFGAFDTPVWDGVRWLMVAGSTNDGYPALYDSVDGVDWRFNQGSAATHPQRLVVTSLGVFAFGESGNVIRLTDRQPQAPKVPHALPSTQRFPATVIGDNFGSLATITGLPPGTQYLLTNDLFSPARIILDESTGAFNVQRTVTTYESGAFEYVAVGEGGRSNTGRIDFLAAVPEPSTYANLAVTVVGPGKTIKLNRNAKFVYSVRHTQGTALATNVTVRINTPPGAVLVAASLKKGSCLLTAAYAQCTLNAPMAPGQSFNGKVKFRSAIPGAMSVTVQALTSTVEIDTADNSMSAVANIGG